MKQSNLTIATVLIAFNLLLVSTAVAEEVFVGNPGKSLNFFHFDLAIERGFFKELGLDVKLLSTKCDIAVTALPHGRSPGNRLRRIGIALYCEPKRSGAHGDLAFQKADVLCRGSAGYPICRRPEGQNHRHQLLRQRYRFVHENVCRHRQTRSGKRHRRIIAGSTSTRLQGLKAGSLDATTLSPPFNVYAEQMGLRVLAYVGDFLEFPQSGFTVSDATLKTKRESNQKAFARHAALFAIYP